MVRFSLSQTCKMDPVSAPFKDVYADLTVSPNQRIGFHADARYNVHDNEQANNQYLKAEAFVRVLSYSDVRTLSAWDVMRGRAVENRVGIDWRFSCWSILAEYVNRHGDENEFRVSTNLLGIGQLGTSARPGF